MVNVHASGGGDMMRAARAAADEEAARMSRTAPLVIAVTMLTSLSDAALPEIGVSGRMGAQVERLSRLAQASGLDGVVASPQEIEIIRRKCGSSFVIVTPGIRDAATDGARRGRDDQRRTMTAADAIAAGATYLVVGRPIIAAADPRAAAERIARACGAMRAT
jgi:orotidine-5'-phosphate decarboxylase